MNRGTIATNRPLLTELQLLNEDLIAADRALLMELKDLNNDLIAANIPLPKKPRSLDRCANHSLFMTMLDGSQTGLLRPLLRDVQRRRRHLFVEMSWKRTCF